MARIQENMFRKLASSLKAHFGQSRRGEEERKADRTPASTRVRMTAKEGETWFMAAVSYQVHQETLRKPILQCIGRPDGSVLMHSRCHHDVRPFKTFMLKGGNTNPWEKR